MSKNALPQEVQPSGKENGKEKKFPFDFENDEIPGVPLAKELHQIDQADMDVIYKKVAALRELYPDGRPMAKRLAPYRVYINTKDIMLLSKCSMRTAQLLLQNTRVVLGLKKGAHVTIDDFCDINDQYKAEDIRPFLTALDQADHE